MKVQNAIVLEWYEEQKEIGHLQNVELVVTEGTNTRNIKLFDENTEFKYNIKKPIFNYHWLLECKDMLVKPSENHRLFIFAHPRILQDLRALWFRWREEELEYSGVTIENCYMSEFDADFIASNKVYKSELVFAYIDMNELKTIK